jgi:hypothetical protein
MFNMWCSLTGLVNVKHRSPVSTPYPTSTLKDDGGPMSPAGAATQHPSYPAGQLYLIIPRPTPSLLCVGMKLSDPDLLKLLSAKTLIINLIIIAECNGIAELVVWAPRAEPVEPENAIARGTGKSERCLFCRALLSQIINIMLVQFEYFEYVRVYNTELFIINLIYSLITVL